MKSILILVFGGDSPPPKERIRQLVRDSEANLLYKPVAKDSWEEVLRSYPGADRLVVTHHAPPDARARAHHIV